MEKDFIILKNEDIITLQNDIKSQYDSLKELIEIQTNILNDMKLIVTSNDNFQFNNDNDIDFQNISFKKAIYDSKNLIITFILGFLFSRII
jgi:hypothetical protein